MVQQSHFQAVFCNIATSVLRLRRLKENSSEASLKAYGNRGVWDFFSGHNHEKQSDG